MTGLDLQDRKLWLGGGALLTLLVLAAAWLLFIGPERSDTDSLRSQTADTITQNSRLEAQSGALAREASSLPALRTKLAGALAALPAQPELPEFTTALTETARRAGVVLTSITVAPLVAPVSAAPAPATSAASSTSASTTPTPTASAGPTQLSAPVTLQITGPGDSILAFLEAVRSGARSATITSTQMTRTGSTFRATAQLAVFSAPMSSGQLANLHRLLETSK